MSKRDTNEHNKHTLHTYPVNGGKSSPIHSIQHGSIDEARSSALDAILSRCGMGQFVGKLGELPASVITRETEPLPECYPVHVLRSSHARTAWKERQKA